MSDARSKRKARVLSFISLLDKDRQINFLSLINKAKKLELEGFEALQWDQSVWIIKAGRLIKHAGKNPSSASIFFQYPPKLGGAEIHRKWADLIKALFLLRFHRKHQSAPNQRNFIAAAAYVAHEAVKHGKAPSELTPEYLDHACTVIASHYSAGVAYNMHKAIGEFAAHCDTNGLCKIHFDYKFSGMKRPETTSGCWLQASRRP